MPIVSVEIVTEEPPPTDLAGRLADALAQVFGGPPSRTWVRLRTLGHYAEGDGGPPPNVLPVFVSVLMANPPPVASRETQAAAISAAVSAASKRPVENVHVLYEPPAAGRIAFGGELVPPH